VVLGGGGLGGWLGVGGGGGGTPNDQWQILLWKLDLA
jgi:hypothetical protein